jgi:hypothetical protein
MADNDMIPDIPSHWPRVWRGENGGEMFEQFDQAKTRHGVGFFFAVREDHAAGYAGCGTTPRKFALDPGLCLDLRDPHARCLRQNPKAAQVLSDLRQAFDDWTDRRSGEPMDLTDFLEAGSLYDYEGTGSGTRWNQLFIEARSAGFDSVLVRDETDGVHGEDAQVWVVFDPSRIHFLEPKSTLVADNSFRPAKRSGPC